MGLASGMAPRLLVSAWVFGIAALAAACSGLPSSGPTAVDIAVNENSEVVQGGYVIVDIDERVASLAAAQPRQSFSRVFTDPGPAPDIRVGVGDAVQVTIWEAADGGLFSASISDRSISAGSRTATLPEQVVSRDGTIRVPYAGRLKVAGLRPGDIEQEIVKALSGKAIEPQAVVTISKNFSNTVTVTGEVTSGARVPISARGERLLEVVAAAGGIRAAAHETFIRLTRGPATANVAFNAILSNPQENIYVKPGDVITVVRDPQTFTAFGGTGRNASVPFDAAGITLEEAIAKAGGLLDYRADPAGVFLLRFEPTAYVAELLPARSMPSAGNLIPVVYRLNLRDANSFFLARAFPVKDKDILYVANAPSDAVQKFLNLVGAVTNPVIAGAAVAGAVK